MTINKTTQDLSTLKINRLTQEMYDDALENDQINATELYLTDYDGVDSTELPTSDKIAEFDASAKMNSTDMTSEEVTTLVNGLSFRNDIDMTQEELQTFLSNLNLYGINAIDYIVEEGTSGNWSYRKWNSGIGECWGTFAFTGVSSAGTIGGFNYATITSAPNFPFTFKATPFVTAGRFYWGSGVGICDVGGVSTTKVTTLWIMSTNVGDKSGVYSLHAIGKWK